jgi:hypothetical protein
VVTAGVSVGRLATGAGVSVVFTGWLWAVEVVNIWAAGADSGWVADKGWAFSAEVPVWDAVEIAKADFSVPELICVWGAGCAVADCFV